MAGERKTSRGTGDSRRAGRSLEIQEMRREGGRGYLITMQELIACTQGIFAPSNLPWAPGAKIVDLSSRRFLAKSTWTSRNLILLLGLYVEPSFQGVRMENHYRGFSLRNPEQRGKKARKVSDAADTADTARTRWVQAIPEVDVDKLTAEEFFDSYIKARRPCIMRGKLNKSSFDQWDNNYLYLTMQQTEAPCGNFDYVAEQKQLVLALSRLNIVRIVNLATGGVGEERGEGFLDKGCRGNKKKMKFSEFLSRFAAGDDTLYLTTQQVVMLVHLIAQLELNLLAGRGGRRGQA
eukprot:754556-Hanusia_phi.AAC.3